VDWVLVAEVATGFTSVASLLFVAWQLEALTRQTSASTNALQAAASMHTFMSAIEIDRFFAGPALRDFFERNRDWYDLIEELMNPPAHAIAIDVRSHRSGSTPLRRKDSQPILIDKIDLEVPAKRSSS
jgi:hypothetical protein